MVWLGLGESEGDDVSRVFALLMSRVMVRVMVTCRVRVREVGQGSLRLYED